jgi:hypothetical protein
MVFAMVASPKAKLVVEWEGDTHGDTYAHVHKCIALVHLSEVGSGTVLASRVVRVLLTLSGDR